jgi:ribosomal protein S18 acetylase RimI-like enzyme
MSDVTVRQVTARDAAVVAKLMSEFNDLVGADGLPDHEHFQPQNTHVSEKQMMRRLELMAPVEKTYVADVQGEPAGLACLRLVPYIGQDVPYAELTQIYVRERFRRNGVGAALLARVELDAVTAGATCVHLITGADNYGAQAFYWARGYESQGVEFEKFFARGGR